MTSVRLHLNVLLYNAETNKNELASNAGINISDIDGSNMTTVLTRGKNYTNNCVLVV